MRLFFLFTLVVAINASVESRKRKRESGEPLDVRRIVIDELVKNPEVSAVEISQLVRIQGGSKSECDQVQLSWFEYRPVFVVPAWLYNGLLGDMEEKINVINRFSDEYLRQTFRVSAQEIAESWRRMCIEASRESNEPSCSEDETRENIVLDRAAREKFRAMYQLSDPPKTILQDNMKQLFCSYVTGYVISFQPDMPFERVIGFVKTLNPDCVVEAFQVERIRLNINFFISFPLEIYEGLEASRSLKPIEYSIQREALFNRYRRSLDGIHITSTALKYASYLWESNCIAEPANNCKERVLLNRIVASDELKAKFLKSIQEKLRPVL